MLVYAGIDEAGYGPLLGPLCVAATVWAVPAAGAATTDGSDGCAETPDLWKLLSKGVCRKPRDRRGRIAFEDSKKLKLPNDAATHPLVHLERGVFAALAVLGARGGESIPQSDDALFALLGAAPEPACHWYRASRPLPEANDAALLGIAARLLERALSAAGVSLLAIQCRAVDAEELNSRVAGNQNKAAINGAVAMKLVDETLGARPGVPMRIAIDRHGGRTHYREELSDAFPGATIRIVEESETASRYSFRMGDRPVHVSWEVGAESRHLPVALASMTAKLVRELWMARLNHFFREQFPELKPTAGYREDGWRWLREVDARLDSLGIEWRRLVRQV